MMMMIRPVVKVSHDFVCRKNCLSNNCFVVGGRVGGSLSCKDIARIRKSDKVITHFFKKNKDYKNI